MIFTDANGEKWESFGGGSEMRLIALVKPKRHTFEGVVFEEITGEKQDFLDVRWFVAGGHVYLASRNGYPRILVRPVAIEEE